MIEVDLRDLNHEIGGVVLRANHLRLERGKRYGLVGQNGSGKSTVLKILALLIQPTRGRVMFDGGAPTRHAVTLALQTPYLFRGTVLSNAAFGLTARGTPRAVAEREARIALASLGLSDFEHRNARRLSAGEGQRLSLVRAFALKTPLLLLDEPFASLDDESAEAVRTMLREPNNHRPTTVIAALDEKDDGFDEILSIRDGEIRRQ